MQVLGKLSELGPRALLLSDLLVAELLLVMRVEESADLVVLALDVV